MRFDIMTLFPDLVKTVLGESIIGRAQKSGAVEINTYNIRDYSEDKHRRVDDTPYGGGKGMLMMAPPIYNCYSAILESSDLGVESPRRRVVYLSPRGKILNHEKALGEALDIRQGTPFCSPCPHTKKHRAETTNVQKNMVRGEASMPPNMAGT